MMIKTNTVLAAHLRLDYDSCSLAQLENTANLALTTQQQSRVQAVIALWRNKRVSKHNHAREYRAALPAAYVLLIYSADSVRFQALLNAALCENPHANLVLLAEGQKLDLAADSRLLVISETVHAVALIEHAQAVYCVDSPLGFDALLWGKRVRTFAQAFYAGWGLSDDEQPVRAMSMPLENLVHAVLIQHSYCDPETHAPCDVERLIDWLGLQRQMRERFPAEVHALGFSHYKRPIVRDFFQGSRVCFDDDSLATSRAVWGSAKIGENNTPLIRLEDGFIRSVGLGADLVRPLSWVMDSCGIYYDATRPSDLEQILQHSDFDAALQARAHELQQRLVGEGLTKYNVGAATWQRPHSKQTIILVAGQVESDASLAYGAPVIRSNLALLRAVRAANPDAYILYKPHPDVVAGLREQGQDENTASHYCDELLIDVSMGQLLSQIDAVHTMTSLTGFEALLRGKSVTCYGQPFYSGWGLTHDIVPLSRRSRRLSLLELIAGALILYPTYISRATDRFTTPERALDELLLWRAQQNATLPWWRCLLRGYLRLEIYFKKFFNNR